MLPAVCTILVPIILFSLALPIEILSCNTCPQFAIWTYLLSLLYFLFPMIYILFLFFFQFFSFLENTDSVFWLYLFCCWYLVGVQKDFFGMTITFILPKSLFTLPPFLFNATPLSLSGRASLKCEHICLSQEKREKEKRRVFLGCCLVIIWEVIILFSYIKLQKRLVIKINTFHAPSQLHVIEAGWTSGFFFLFFFQAQSAC